MDMHNLWEYDIRIYYSDYIFTDDSKFHVILLITKGIIIIRCLVYIAVLIYSYEIASIYMYNDYFSNLCLGFWYLPMVVCYKVL